ncbi:GGDEF domain-containing protein [Shewanella sedimentimangrovi]|uniref:diguanylate cyclase n=1 Tax=Shewanella sedimentimangrovi TaxID=2814293 RepID=A0ABX7R3C2_9GAMM|nr:GGDEF domain-containing protein [Shewanella sedimentimangrovi]QSX38322.1 GGDEF domain-containing protein [Shewanella sedimentimangrovi]
MDLGFVQELGPESFGFSTDMLTRDSCPTPDLSQLLQITRQLHSSLDPRTVFACYGKVLGQYLPLLGVQGLFPELQLSWGKRLGTAFERHLGLEDMEDARLQYHWQRPLSPRELSLLIELEGLLSQPLINAIRYFKMSEQAMFDSLTGLGNRHYYGQCFKQALARTSRHHDDLSLVILDLDNFKQLNDAYGHQFGDAVLRQFGAMLKQAIRNTDQAFRIGGDEFVLLVRGDVASVAILCERILDRMTSEGFFARNQIRTSIGAAQLRAGENQDQVYERADRALYQAKAAGRNCYRLELAA